MLVVDLHALQSINFLDLVGQVGCQSLDTEHQQDVVGYGITVHQRIPLHHVVALLDADVLALGNQVFPRLAIAVLVGGNDDDPSFGLVVLAELDATVDLADDGVILGFAGFEQLRDPRQTAGNIAGLRRFTRNSSEHVASINLLARLHRQDRVHRQKIARLQPVIQGQNFAVLVAKRHSRPEIGTPRLLLPVDHHLGCDAGRLVELLDHRQTFDEVHVVNDSLLLGDDRQGIGIPFRDSVAALDLRLVLAHQLGPVRKAVPGSFTSFGVEHQRFGIPVHDHRHAGAVAHRRAIPQGKRTVGHRLDLRLLGAALDGAADVEGAHGELGARLTNRLGGNHADSFADIDLGPTGEVTPVAGGTDTGARIAGQHRPYLYHFHVGQFDRRDRILVNHPAGGHDDRTGGRVDHVLGGRAAEHPLAERRDHFAPIDHRTDGDAVDGAAVDHEDDAVLSDVDQTSGQVTGVRGLQRRIGEALTGAVGGVEVLQHRQPFLEVRDDRRLDDLAGRLGHQPAHAGKLFHLRGRAAGSRVGHHVDRVDRMAGLGRGNALHHLVGHLVGAVSPGIDDFVVLLAPGDQAVLVLLLVLLDPILGRPNKGGLLLGYDQVVLAEGNARPGGVGEAHAHDPVGEDHRFLLPTVSIDGVERGRELLLGQQPVDQIQRHVRVPGQCLGKQHSARRRIDQNGHRLPLFVDGPVAGPDFRVQGDRPSRQGVLDFAEVGERHAFPRLARSIHGQIVDTEHDVLRGNDDRLAVRRAEDVVGGHHQHPRLELSFQGKRHVDRHLVAVEVGIERGADQGVELDRLALDQHRLESLDAEAVQGRRPIEKHRMFANHLLENVPNLRALLLQQALGRLDRRRHPVKLELRIDERLEQFERHLLRQPAFMQFQFRPDDDHRAARVVHPLAEQVLAEPALLALQHVAERLQRPFAGPGDRTAAAAVVEQGIDRFLQHPLFIANDDFGRPELDQPLQAVVAVDDPPIQIVEIRGREAAAVERHQRPELRRDHRDDLHDHPFGPGAGIDKSLDQLQSLDILLALDFRSRLLELFAQRRALGLEIDRLQHIARRLGADTDRERVFAVFLDRPLILLFADQFVKLERSQPRLDDHVALEVENLLQVLQGHVHEQADPARQRLQEPDVGGRRGKLDMAHALAADLLQGHFDAALLARNPLVFHPLVLAAQALVVLHRTEDAGAEQSVALRLEGAVVDRLRLLDLAKGP